MRGQYSATAANALDHAVERRVLAIDWIVRIRQVFLRGHLIGARLAVPDRCAIQHQLVVRVRRWSAAGFGEPAVCAIATEVPTRASNAIVVINLRTTGLPIWDPLTIIMITGSSITRSGKPHDLFRCSSVSQLGVLAVSIHLTELIRYVRQWNGKPSRSRCARTTKLRVLSSESVANRFRGRRADLDGSTRGNSDLDVRNCRHQGNWPPMARDKRQPCELQRCQR